MQIKQRTTKNITSNFLIELLEDRKVLPKDEKQRQQFLNPTIQNEHNSELLDHMSEGWKLLEKHLIKGSKIYLVVD